MKWCVQVRFQFRNSPGDLDQIKTAPTKADDSEPTDLGMKMAHNKVVRVSDIEAGGKENQMLHLILKILNLNFLKSLLEVSKQMISCIKNTLFLLHHSF